MGRLDNERDWQTTKTTGPVTGTALAMSLEMVGRQALPVRPTGLPCVSYDSCLGSLRILPDETTALAVWRTSLVYEFCRPIRPGFSVFYACGVSLSVYHEHRVL